MTRRLPYDDRYEPPAPVLPVLISAPNAPGGIGVSALVDSGADVSVVPADVIRALGLPIVAWTEVRGYDGTSRRTEVHAATMQVEGLRTIVEVIGLGNEALIGRDVLNQVRIVLDGPKRTVEIKA